MQSMQRARYEQWMFFTPGTLEPPAFEILMHTSILPEKHRIPGIVGFAEKQYQRVLHMLEKELDHDGYLLGEYFSCADILLGTTLTWLPEQLESFSALQSYVERVTARPAYQHAMQP
jgi:glutathione S-transferase